MPKGVHERKRMEQCPKCTKTFNVRGITTHISHCKGVSDKLAVAIPSKDEVNHPSHYTFGKFEVIDILMDWFSAEPLLWQVVKYVARAKHKGNYLQDLKKAEFYLKMQIDIFEKAGL